MLVLVRKNTTIFQKSFFPSSATLKHKTQRSVFCPRLFAFWGALAAQWVQHLHCLPIFVEVLAFRSYALKLYVVVEAMSRLAARMDIGINIIIDIQVRCTYDRLFQVQSHFAFCICPISEKLLCRRAVLKHEHLTKRGMPPKKP